MTKPFIKCAGGKRLLADIIISHMPDEITTYCEPFLGGGAVFFRLHELGRLDNAKVILNEFDPDLADLWRSVQSRPRTLLHSVEPLFTAYARDPKDTYLRVRREWNEGLRSPERNLFLRYTCYNGLWRMSKAGNMNTPWGKYVAPAVPVARILACSHALQNAHISDGSYVNALRLVEPGPGTAVYLDPPYDGGFVMYTSAGFGDRDQHQLLVTAATLAERGARVLYTNTANDRVASWLDVIWPDGTVHAITARRTIAPTAKGRGDAKEFLVVQ